MIFINRFNQDSKNIKHMYIDGKHSRDNGKKLGRTCRALKIKMWFSALNSPIIVRNSRYFEFLFFLSRHRAVRKKHFWQKTFPIGSRRWCRSLSAVTFSYEKLELQACEAFPYFAPQKWSKWHFEARNLENGGPHEKTFFTKLVSITCLNTLCFGGQGWI